MTKTEQRRINQSLNNILNEIEKTWKVADEAKSRLDVIYSMVEDAQVDLDRDS